MQSILSRLISPPPQRSPVAEINNQSHNNINVNINRALQNDVHNKSQYQLSSRSSPGSPDSSSTSDMCSPDCQFPDDHVFIRCSICMGYFHNRCVDEDSKCPDIFCCFACRTMPKQLINISQEISKIKVKQINSETTMENNMELILSQMQNISSDMSSLKVSFVNLQENYAAKCIENDQLQSKIAALELKLSKPNPVSTSTESQPTLVIGSSLIKDIIANDESKLDIKCKPGSKLEDLADTLKSMEHNNKRYEKITVVAGGNNCDNPDATVEDISNAAVGVIDQALRISKNVSFSSILPRNDKGATLLKIENVNPAIKQKLNPYHNVEFIDNEPSFRLADGSPNESYFLKDKIHLTYNGSERLIKNLNLPAKVKRRQRYQYNNNYNQRSQQQQIYNTYSYSQPEPSSYYSQIPSVMAQEVRSSEITCRYCNFQGHTAMSCPRTAQFTCFRCRQKGHIQRFCTSS